MAASSLPAGFAEAVGIINRIPQDVTAELCYEVASLLQYKVQAVNVEKFHSILEALDSNINKGSINAMVAALVHVFKSAAKSKLTPDVLSRQLKESLLWTDSSVAAVKHVWKDQGQNVASSEVIEELFSVGQLVDLRWKLGMAVSSDSCRNLNSPVVTMTLKIANPSGEVISKTFEMTVAQFQNFSSQMKEMAKVLQTV